MVTITLKDEGGDRYTLSASSSTLGRMYDNISEGITVVKPLAETGRTCTMIITNDECGVLKKTIDEVPIGSNPINIIDSWSCYRNITIGFSFSDNTGYVKNSEFKTFNFLPALKPNDWTPVEPVVKQRLTDLFNGAFVNVEYSQSVEDTLVFKNIYGTIVDTITLEGIGQVQADMAVTDPTNVAFIKNKQLKQDTLVSGTNIKTLNGQSILGAGNLVIESGLIDVIKKNGTPLPIVNKTVDIAIPTKTSDITNDSGFIDKTVNNLDNYTNNTVLTTKLNKTVQSDTGVGVNVDNVTLNKSYVNIDSGATSQSSTTIPLANDTTGGIMSHSDYQQIRENTSRIENLEAQTTRLLYTSTTVESDVNIASATTLNTGSRLAVGSILNGVTLSEITEISQDTQMTVGDKIATNSVIANGSIINGASVPTQADILAFVTDLGYTSPFAGIAVVVSMTYHIWHYYQNGGIGWRDDGADTVNQFTNLIAGVIKGSSSNGQIYAETNGTGSVNGWDALNTTVTNLGQDKQDKLIAGANITIAADGKTISATDTTDYNDLTNKPIINADLSTLSAGSAVVNQTYRHTGTTTADFTQNKLYVSDGTSWSVIGGGSQFDELYADDILSKSLVLGDPVELAVFNTTDNHWHIANSKVDDSLSIASDLIISGIENIKDNNSKSLFWHGTQAEYDAIQTKNAGTLYIIVPSA